MNVEKTIQAILESQLGAEKRADRFDKQLSAIAKLVQAGMKIVQESNYKINALIDAQNRADERTRKNEEKFIRLLEQLGRKSTNGHKS
jgi:hypothetical protein